MAWKVFDLITDGTITLKNKIMDVSQDGNLLFNGKEIFTGLFEEKNREPEEKRSFRPRGERLKGLSVSTTSETTGEGRYKAILQEPTEIDIEFNTKIESSFVTYGQYMTTPITLAPGESLFLECGVYYSTGDRSDDTSEGGAVLVYNVTEAQDNKIIDFEAPILEIEEDYDFEEENHFLARDEFTNESTEEMTVRIIYAYDYEFNYYYDSYIEDLEEYGESFIDPLYSVVMYISRDMASEDLPLESSLFVYREYTPPFELILSSGDEFAQGEGTKTRNSGGASFGRFNKNLENSIFEVGIGESIENTENAISVDVKGEITTNSILVGAPSKYANPIRLGDYKKELQVFENVKKILPPHDTSKLYVKDGFLVTSGRDKTVNIYRESDLFLVSTISGTVAHFGENSTILNGHIYIVGGENNSPEVFKYNILSGLLVDSVSDISIWTNPGQLKVAASNSHIFMVHSGQGKLFRIEEDLSFENITELVKASGTPSGGMGRILSFWGDYGMITFPYINGSRGKVTIFNGDGTAVLHEINGILPDESIGYYGAIGPESFAYTKEDTDGNGHVKSISLVTFLPFEKKRDTDDNYNLSGYGLSYSAKFLMGRTSWDGTNTSKIKVYSTDSFVLITELLDIGNPTSIAVGEKHAYLAYNENSHPEATIKVIDLEKNVWGAEIFLANSMSPTFKELEPNDVVSIDNAIAALDSLISKNNLGGGSSEERPSLPSETACSVPYFDTELGKPIWWNGTDWIDSSGNTV